MIVFQELRSVWQLSFIHLSDTLITSLFLYPSFHAPLSHVFCLINAVLDIPDTDLLKHSDECFGFIDEAISSGGNVLVHCFAGRSRR
jgi:protein-tyrosine phosphatase